MIKIIDNLLPKSFNNKIKEDIKEARLPFYSRESNVDYSKLSQFTHHCYNKIDNNQTSDYFNVISPMLYFIEKECNLIITELDRLKINIITSKHLVNKELDTALHMDSNDKDFLSFLYYVNTSDGDTCFYNEDGTILQKVTPKENTGVLFNSNILHRATPPLNTDVRIVINVMFKADDS